MTTALMAIASSVGAGLVAITVLELDARRHRRRIERRRRQRGGYIR